MKLDARRIPSGTLLEADICIVGAGAAGITIACELAESGLAVLLMEAGGEDYDDEAQSLYAGRSLAGEIDPAVNRLRQLGGSTNHWGGRSRPFEPEDFAERPWVADSGWPIAYADFAAHLPRALELCEIETAGLTAGDGLAEALPFARERIESGLWRFSPPTQFGARYGAALERSDAVRLVLHANLVDIGLDEGCGRVERLEFATLTGNRLAVASRFTVLACGGLENPRLLLASRRQMSRGIGNGRDLVGRCFMGHPIWEPMEIQLAPGARLPRLYSQARRADGESEGMVRLARSAQAELGTTCVDGAFYTGGQFGPPGMRAARRLWQAARRGKVPDRLGRDIATLLGGIGEVAKVGMSRIGIAMPEPAVVTVSTLVEQPPDRQSRVMLGDELDMLGMPRLAVDWRVGDAERQAMAAFCRVLGEEVGRIGLGRARLADWIVDPEMPLPRHSNSAHHLGTTRMGEDPATSVVDRHCRIHGIGNLFVAGSSVFPTGGSVHPTLNLVALAVRLASHLRVLATRNGMHPLAALPDDETVSR
ncbi:MAG TPA: GMC family oxidoreductase [Geminicoccaceae bacterium]|nr:GMC family oxidoreductase [Geminicoccus sp.]HMU48305.1 GMC family oxidoreductase [Geminicoccaceae bacterium]